MSETLTGERIPPLPLRRALRGPVTNRLLLTRGLLPLACAWVLGVALVVLAPSGRWVAFGAGLTFPGGGFLVAGHPVYFALAGLAFGLAFVLWFVLGPMFVPPLVWLVAAGLAGWAAGDDPTAGWATAVVPALLPVALLVGGTYQRVKLRSGWREAAERNERLAGLRRHPSPGDAGRRVGELSEEDLRLQRFMLDLALQPYESFAGYDSVEQFREGAYRYNLNYVGWALALSTYTRTPAFSGYLAEAQRMLIEKVVHPRVWGYWFWENLWGNLRVDRDPIRRDNIMLSGYLAAQIAAYEAVTGDERFGEPGALTFTWKDGRAFPYDRDRIVEQVERQLGPSNYGMYPCEPNWVFPVCNTIAMAGLAGHDRRHGTDLAGPHLDRFRASLDREFADPAGHPIAVRSSRLGLTMPGLTKSTMNEGYLPFWFNPTVPDIAARYWSLARQELMSIDADGRGVLRFQSALDRIDLATYRLGWGAWTHGMLTVAAAEMGDDEMRHALIAATLHHDPLLVRDGVARHSSSSIANAWAFAGRVGERDAWRTLLLDGLPAAERTGPRLCAAAYPEVLVARAVSDGADLSLVLRPGAGPTRATLDVDRLLPGRGYRLDGGGSAGVGVTADPDGRARLEVTLDGRTELRLVPAPG